MKGFKLIFAAICAPLVLHAATADDAVDLSRAANRRDTTTTVTSTRKKTDTPKKATTKQTASRTADTATAPRETPHVGNRATTAPRPTDKAVTARTTSTVLPRTIKTTSVRTTSARPATTTARATTRTTALSTPSRTDGARARAATDAASRARTAKIARATTSADILNRDYSKCRQVFHDCMDEFCANKDSQLKRCACSARMNEFDKTKKSLASAEDKLLDFSQRLLTVNMDAEDAMAINTATEGEIAYAAKDTSKSKKLLDEIAKKLNTSFNNSNFDQNLNAISLSLNTDMAFDSVSSMMGASTTSKSGTDLYRSALPICRQMTLEICDQAELDIAESSYLMAIEQDCNTVSKSYQTQVDQARTKVLESSALLDMSRLDIYQQRNSDDILTCKRKMLDMLTDTTICGTDLGKCLDTSGRYIDPTTGTAFLTTDLWQLSKLIERPTAQQTWTNTPGNYMFVNFINSKKTYLEPAMEKCQDISDYVWDSFLEDALAQIKLAQDLKLEQMRQSCTTLTTQCLDETLDSITEFDARALSIFGIAADRTVNAMCADVTNACTALLANTGDIKKEWETGMSGIATDKTYESILQTCREVGRSCIIQVCTSTSGNFGLCESIDTSINRKAIITGTACWDKVKECVLSAGDALTDIAVKHPSDNFLTEVYGTAPSPKYSVCNSADKDTYACFLTERIWGHCEHSPTDKNNPTNKIIIPSDNTSTLLAWFAVNTGTNNHPDSCRDTSCPAGYTLNANGGCSEIGNVDICGNDCNDNKITVANNIVNCCSGDILNNICCADGIITGTIANDSYVFGIDGRNENTMFCRASTNVTTPTLVATYTLDDAEHLVMCYGTVNQTGGNVTDTYPNGTNIVCNGQMVIVNTNTNIHNVIGGRTTNYIQTGPGATCTTNDGAWNCNGITKILGHIVGEPTTCETQTRAEQETSGTNQ